MNIMQYLQLFAQALALLQQLGIKIPLAAPVAKGVVSGAPGDAPLTPAQQEMLSLHLMAAHIAAGVLGAK